MITRFSSAKARGQRPVRAAALVAALAIVFVLGQQAASAQAIKLGSLGPTGSSWDATLRKIAAEWSRLSGGQVRVTIYPGGVVGDEPDMIRKMRIGQLQAAALTAIGASHINPSILAPGFPLLVRTDSELEQLLDRLSPRLEAGFEANGYQLLTWSVSGWIYFFSRKPVLRPDDLRAQKVWMWEGNAEEMATWTALGFQTVPLKATDVMMALQSGMIDACCVSPMAAAAYQWFAAMPNMLDVKWTPMYGVVVMSRGAWEKIPADLRPRLLAAARSIGREMNAANAAAEKQAVDVMLARGLRITQPQAADLDLWRDVARAAAARLVGKIVDRESYQQATTDLESIRR